MRGNGTWNKTQSESTSMVPNLRGLLAATVLLFLSKTMGSTNASFVGKYDLMGGTDTSGKAIEMPNGNFSLEIAEPRNVNNEGEVMSYPFYLTIGNNMGTDLQIKKGLEIKGDPMPVSLGQPYGTRMYPGPELSKLESQLSEILPKLTFMKQEDKGITLTEGETTGGASLVFASSKRGNTEL